MSASDFKMNCGDVGPLLVFLACDEVTAEERAALEAHAALRQGEGPQLAGLST